MSDTVLGGDIPRQIIRNLEIETGNSVHIFFSTIAASSGHSINFFLGNAIVLHIIIRAEKMLLVANDRLGERWGGECVLGIPDGGLAAGLGVTVTFLDNRVSLQIPGAPALEIEDRFVVLGEARVEFAPSIALRDSRQAATTPPEIRPSPPQGAEEVIARGASAPQQEQGYVDYFAICSGLGGLLLGGWVKNPCRLEGKVAASAVFEGHEHAADAMVLLHERSDIASLGVGYAMVLPDFRPSAEGPWVLRSLRARMNGRDFLLLPSPGLEATSENEALQTARNAARRALRDQVTALPALLRRPIYTGEDTLGPLGLPVHIEVDDIVGVRPGAAVLIGWRLDPQELVASIHLRCGAAASPALASTEIRVARGDIVEAFGARYGIADHRAGFVAYGDTGGTARDACFLEIRLVDGRIAFKPLPHPVRTGLPAIRRILGMSAVASNDMARVFGTVLGPPILELNRRRLARATEAEEVTFGTPPAAPRLSLVIPLYGRLDFLRYQLAMFSRGGLEGDEIVYVLDEPSKKETLLTLANAAFGSFGVPFRVILPAENRGFGPASNLGMRHARGRYVCFLNSDIFPERSDFFDLLVERLERDPGIGIVGGLLLFADGSVQHAGMDFVRPPELGGWLFPTHPGKGRLPPPDLPDVIVAPAITGACMVIARDLALDLGGFDPDYLIGDFEDADLCRRIARRGLRCVVDTRARAHHLERQSQGDSAEQWRRNVTLLNAWIFNTSTDDGRDVDPAGHAEAADA
jgi:GT2 family glycosyltransferase